MRMKSRGIFNWKVAPTIIYCGNYTIVSNYSVQNPLKGVHSHFSHQTVIAACGLPTRVSHFWNRFHGWFSAGDQLRWYRNTTLQRFLPIPTPDLTIPPNPTGESKKWSSLGDNEWLSARQRCFLSSLLSENGYWLAVAEEGIGERYQLSWSTLCCHLRKMLPALTSFVV
jgi:hypothetical protein